MPEDVSRSHPVLPACPAPSGQSPLAASDLCPGKHPHVSGSHLVLLSPRLVPPPALRFPCRCLSPPPSLLPHSLLPHPGWVSISKLSSPVLTCPVLQAGHLRVPPSASISDRSPISTEVTLAFRFSVITPSAAPTASLPPWPFPSAVITAVVSTLLGSQRQTVSVLGSRNSARRWSGRLANTEGPSEPSFLPRGPCL